MDRAFSPPSCCVTSHGATSHAGIERPFGPKTNSRSFAALRMRVFEESGFWGKALRNMEDEAGAEVDQLRGGDHGWAGEEEAADGGYAAIAYFNDAPVDVPVQGLIDTAKDGPL